MIKCVLLLVFGLLAGESGTAQSSKRIGARAFVQPPFEKPQDCSKLGLHALVESETRARGKLPAYEEE